LAIVAFAGYAGNVSALTVSPTVSSDGSYTVYFSSPTTCYEDWSYYPIYFIVIEYCSYLYESQNGGGYTYVPTGNGATSWTAAGKTNGTYQYEILEYISYSGGPYLVEGPATVQVQNGPEPPELGVYATRTGDVDGDGDIDIYVKRVAGTSSR